MLDSYQYICLDSYQYICLDAYLTTACDRGLSLALLVLVCDHGTADEDDRWDLARVDLDRAACGIPSIFE